MLLKDIRGRTLPAVEVFSLSIQALKNHLTKTVEVRGVCVDDRKTKWVLTVPAIWTETAKCFMRKSAEMAGIPSDMLSIALEPEAASIYYQTFPPVGCKGIVKDGAKYLIVDVGGGTTDITVHEKLSNGTLKELVKATGDDCGGTSVDNQYIQMFIKIFGRPFLNEFKDKFPESYLSLIRGFEATKRTIETSRESVYENVAIPFAALDELCKAELKEDLRTILANSSQADRLKLYGDKIRIKTEYAKSFFKQTNDQIVSLIQELLLEKEVLHIEYILLVGGFASCELVQAAIKSHFPGKTVVVPEDASTAVLKGAVLSGFNTDHDYISSRVMRYTYGMEITPNFDSKKHDIKRKIYIDGKPYCNKVFSPFIMSNTSVNAGKEICKRYTTTQQFQNSHNLPIFFTEKEGVNYTDDETCIKLGTVYVGIMTPTEYLRHVDVKFHFGGTELNVTAEDEESGKQCKTSFEIQDFLLTKK
ncbi:unnamed protein product [Mytilus coruscus]|uniref:Uncharacterized protein n=1 Tax=Mytilus coruscus TaxID=42192 RepID=A0A6J8EG90_MYTCO|nr:unnamed protein product [Mytilus coruscus]